MPGPNVDLLPSGGADAFRALFQQEVVGVGQAGPDGRLVSANPRLCAMLGYEPGELLGMSIDAITHPDSRVESSRHMLQLFERGQSYVLEKEYVCKDGSSLWGAVNVTAVRDATGAVVSVLAVVLDVTERKRAERTSAFLAELTSCLATAREEKEILRTSLDALAHFLDVPCVFFAECDEGEGRLRVSGQRVGAGAGAFVLRSRLEQMGGSAWWQHYARGDVAVERASGTDALPFDWGGGGARSYAVQALERKGGERLTLAAVSEASRSFRRDELALLGDFLARVWPLVERARTEAALQAELKAVEGLLVERHQSLAKRRAADDLVSRLTAEADRRHRLFETILSSAPDLIYVFDLQRRFIYANTALLDAWGRGPSELIGRTCGEVGYPAWQASMHDSEIDLVVTSKQSIRGEVPFKGPQGERIHDYIFVPVIGADGEVEAIAGTTRDVTALKQAENLMAGQAQALELMVQGAPLLEVLEALCDVVDRQATSRRCTSIMLAQDDGQHLLSAAGRHMPAGWSRAVDPWPVGAESGGCGTAAFLRKTVISSDLQLDPLWQGRRELAARYDFRASWSTPILSSGGSVLGTLALYYPRVHFPDALERRLVDIVTRTAGIAIERKRDEEGLKTHSERLRLLWETAAVLLTTEKPDALMPGVFGRIAPHLELDVVLTFAVVDEGKSLRLSFKQGISPADADALALLDAESPLGGGVTTSQEPWAVADLQNSDDPRYAPLKAMGLRAYACLPFNADERVLGVLAVGSRARGAFEADELEFLRTVTRYMTIAYERGRLVRELRDADRKKDDFIALLAHELRNPLAPLRNGLHVMRLAAHDSAAVARARAIMERQLSHMVRLIDDLLDISRISLNKLQLRRTAVSLADIVSNAVETARPALDSAEHRLEVVLPSEPVLLDADLTRLAQVLGNLLTNAAKFTPKHGQIRLEAELDADSVTISVADNGIGLQPESLLRIFEMFSQVDRSVERTSGGLGIGLALVKGLTEMHGGSVRAESAGPGQGSRFSVRLPLAAAVAQGVLPVAQRAPPPRRRILVADDNADALESLTTMLRLSGNEVHLARDGLEAVALAEQLNPDVVLMDIGMPNLNGRDATRRIRAQEWGKQMVVIALTGWGQESDRRLSREAGCDDHLVKPIDVAELDRLLRELCGRGPTSASPQSSGHAKGALGSTLGDGSAAGGAANS